MTLKNILLAGALLLAIQTVQSQNFPYKAELKSSLNDSVFTEITKDTYIFVAENEISFNFGTSDVENNEKTPLIASIRNKKPASLDSIEALKAELKGNWKDAQSEYKIAMQYYNMQEQEGFENHIEKAFDYSETAIEKMPDSIGNYMIKIQILNLFGRQAETEAVYLKAIENIPDNEGAYLMLSMLYMQAGRNAEAEEIIRKGIKEMPNEVGFYFNLSLNEFFKHAYAEEEKQRDYIENTPLPKLFKLDEFAAVAKKHKRDFEFYTTYQMMRVFALFFKTIYSLDEAEDVENAELSAPVQKQIKKLRKYFNKYIRKSKKASNPYILHYSLGTLSIIEGNLHEAAKSYEAARKTRLQYADVESSSPHDIYRNLYAVHILNEDTAEAHKVLEEKCRLLPTADDFNLLTISYMNANNYKKAEQKAAEALNTGYFNVQTVRAAVILYLETGQPAAADEYLVEIFNAYPDDFESLILAGISAAMQKDAKNAAHFFEKAYQQNPESAVLNKIAERIFVPRR